MERRLFRSRSERMIAGVCGGLARYFDMDVAIVRIIFALLVLANGLGIVIYVIMAIVVPLEGSKTTESSDTIKENVEEMKETAEGLGREIKATFTGVEKADVEEKIRQRRNIIGIALIIIGVISLMGTLNVLWWFRWGYLWPLIPVAVGLIIIFSPKGKK